MSALLLLKTSLQENKKSTYNLLKPISTESTPLNEPFKHSKTTLLQASAQWTKTSLSNDGVTSLLKRRCHLTSSIHRGLIQACQRMHYSMGCLILTKHPLLHLAQKLWCSTIPQPAPAGRHMQTTHGTLVRPWTIIGAIVFERQRLVGIGLPKLHISSQRTQKYQSLLVTMPHAWPHRT